jgi:hypothetical protein
LEQIKSSTVLNFKFQFLLSGQAPTSQPTQSHSHCHQVPCISPRAAGPLVNPGPSYQPRPSLPCAARDASRCCSPALPSTPRGAAPQAPPHVTPSTIAPPPPSRRSTFLHFHHCCRHAKLAPTVFSAAAPPWPANRPNACVPSSRSSPSTPHCRRLTMRRVFQFFSISPLTTTHMGRRRFCYRR